MGRFKLYLSNNWISSQSLLKHLRNLLGRWKKVLWEGRLCADSQASVEAVIVPIDGWGSPWTTTENILTTTENTPETSEPPQKTPETLQKNPLIHEDWCNSWKGLLTHLHIISQSHTFERCFDGWWSPEGWGVCRWIAKETGDISLERAQQLLRLQSWSARYAIGAVYWTNLAFHVWIGLVREPLTIVYSRVKLTRLNIPDRIWLYWSTRGSDW